MIDKITKIEYVGDLPTVDIQVSGDNLFYANDILTHNSGFNESDPKLDSLSESVGVAATADFIMGLWQDDEDIEFQTIHAGIMKNRFGRAIGTKRFSIDFATLTLGEFDEETISNTDEANEIYNTLKMLTDS